MSADLGAGSYFAIGIVCLYLCYAILKKLGMISD
jgi:hypothetical protein